MTDKNCTDHQVWFTKGAQRNSNITNSIKHSDCTNQLYNDYVYGNYDWPFNLNAIYPSSVLIGLISLITMTSIGALIGSLYYIILTSFINTIGPTIFIVQPTSRIFIGWLIWIFFIIQIDFQNLDLFLNCDWISYFG